MSNNIRKGRHCVFNLHVHLVFVTKYRREIFTAEILQSLQKIFQKVCEANDTILVECNGERDHVHLLLHYPPTSNVAKIVNSLKGVSSRMLRQTHPEIQDAYWKGVLWSPSYFAASCGGAPIDIIKLYIERQNRPD